MCYDTPRVRESRSYAMLVLGLILGIVAASLLCGCRTQVRGAMRDEMRQGAIERRSETGKQSTHTTTVEQVGKVDADRITAWINDAGKIIAVAWTHAVQAAGEVRTETVATSQPSITAETIGKAERVVDTGPVAIGTANVSIDGDKIETKQETPNNAKYMVFGGIVLLVLAALAAWKVSLELAGLLAGAAAVLLSWPWLGPWVALVIGLSLIVLVVYLAYWLWQRSLSGAAKLAKEGKTEEAIAALRASAPELDAAFKGAK